MRDITVLAVLACALVAATDSKWVTHNKRTTESCSCDCSTPLAATCADPEYEGFSLYTDGDGAEVCLMVSEDSKYYADIYDKGWANARSECADYTNGRLFKANTTAKMNLLRDYSGETNLWVGLDDLDWEGNYIWSDGWYISDGEKSALFQEGQPNNNAQWIDCVEWNGNTANDTGLNDRKCTVYLRYACEIFDATATEKRAVKRTIDQSCACSCNAAAVACAANEGFSLHTDDDGTDVCLKVTADKGTYTAAEEKCETADNRRLFVCNTAAKMKLLEDYGLDNIAVGLSDRDAEGTFVWKNGDILSDEEIAELFKKNQPSGSGDCVKWKSSFNLLFDDTCEGKNTWNYACEIFEEEADAKRAIKSTENDTDTKRVVRTLLKMLKQYV